MAYLITDWKEALKTPAGQFSSTSIISGKTRVLAMLLVDGFRLGALLFGFAVVARGLIASRRGDWLTVAHRVFLIDAPIDLLNIASWSVFAINEAWVSWLQNWAMFLRALTVLAWQWVAIRVHDTRPWRSVAIFQSLSGLVMLVYHMQRMGSRAQWLPFVHPLHFLGPMGTLHLITMVAVALFNDRRRVAAPSPPRFLATLALSAVPTTLDRAHCGLKNIEYRRF